MTTAIQSNQPKTLTKKATFIFLGCLILFSFYLGFHRPPIVKIWIKHTYPDSMLIVQHDRGKLPHEQKLDYKLRYWLYLWTGIPPTHPVVEPPPHTD